MRKNIILGAAISAALSLSATVTVVAGGFENVSAESDMVNFTKGAEASSNVIMVDTNGTIYAKELFGGDNTGPDKLPNSDTKNAAVIYTLTLGSNITEKINAIFTLSDGVFAENPELAVYNGGSNDDPYATLLSINSGGEGKNSATFSIDCDDTSNDYDLYDGSQLLLHYNFKEAAILTTTDGKVSLTADLQKVNETPVNPSRTVTIATSKQAITPSLASETSGMVEISVIDGNTKFASDGKKDAYVSTNTAQIGRLEITVAPDVKQSDGVTGFTFATTAAGSNDGETEDAVLEITGGQFAASQFDGGVILANAGGTTVVTGSAADETTATLDLDGKMDDIITNSGEVDIRMVVDGQTAINTVGETPPSATLTIGFAQDYINDIVFGPVELLRIKQNGTVCVVYNVPGSGASDELNIRITNESSAAGELTGILYSKSGDPIGTSMTLAESLPAGETIRITAPYLEDKAGTWAGRAILEITSTLPDIEVLAMLRNRVPGSPLTNVSTGASGNSCN